MRTMRGADLATGTAGMAICIALAALVFLAAVLAEFPLNSGDSSQPPGQPAASASTMTPGIPTEPVVASEHEMLHRTFRALARVLTEDGLGTAFLYRRDDESTYFVTNAHVVEREDTPTVRTSDGAEHRAIVIGRDDDVDLAVLRVTGITMNEPLAFADSDRLEIAEPVYVVGYVLGSDLLGDPSVTHGIVSGRRVQHGIDYVQTDAVMNPGNSGGPVIDRLGEVVGMATWGIREAGYEPIVSINCAIPSNTIVAVADEMIAHAER